MTPSDQAVPILTKPAIRGTGEEAREALPPACPDVKDLIVERKVSEVHPGVECALRYHRKHARRKDTLWGRSGGSWGQQGGASGLFSGGALAAHGASSLDQTIGVSPGG